MNSKLEKSFRNLSISRSSLSEKEDVISKNSDANQSFEKPLFDRPVLPPEVFEEEQKQSFSNKASADNLASQQDTETFEIVSFKAGKTLTQLSSLPPPPSHEELASNPFSQEETKENKQSFAKNQFAVKRRRDDTTTDELKKIKKEVQTLNPEDLSPIAITLHRTYSSGLKKKVIGVAKRIGAVRTSITTGVPESTVRRWVKLGSTSNTQNCGRRPQFESIEKDLIRLFKQQRSEGIPISNKYLIQEARKIGAGQSIKDFLGTNSWLDGFKRRYKIGYRKSTHVSQKLKANSKDELKNFQDKLTQLIDTHHYAPEAIANVDEAGIYFDSPPNFTLDFKVTVYFTSDNTFIGKKRYQCHNNRK